MNLSVRLRIAVAVGLIGAAAFAAVALAAPDIVRSSLEADLLESEAEDVAFLLSFDFDESVFDGVVIDVGPDTTDTDDIDDTGERPADSALEVVAATDDLADTLAILDDAGRFDAIVEAAGGGSFVVAFDADTAVLVEPDQTIIDRPDGPDAADGPILFSGELDEYLFDDLGFVAIGDELFAEAGDGNVLLRSVELDGTEYLVAADSTSIDRTVGEIRRTLWWAVPALTATVAILGWVLAARALRPVGAITDRAATITAGTLDARVPVPTTGDEIAELAGTVNGMLDRIESDDRRRRRFVSDASHELRTPIAVMRNDAEVALRHPDGVAVTDLAGTVADEAGRLSTIIDDLLALARHDEHRHRDPADDTARSLAEIDLDDVVLAEAERTRRVPVSLHQVSAGRVRGNADEFGRLVAHLLDNAARHADAAVAVAVRSDGDDVVLTVDDDGPGIDAADRATVFERFTRLDEARTRDGGGAGLGLAVVQGIAERSGGTVTVTDAPLGGARFVVTLPAA
ncbi:MAG: ATP-binding protein [Actinomycetota bacterium]